MAISLVGFRVALGQLPDPYRPPPVNDISKAVLDEPPERRVELAMQQWTAPETVDITDAAMFDWSSFPAMLRLLASGP